MNTPDIKAYYRAAITPKEYVICEPLTFNAGGFWITKCTDTLPEKITPDVHVISTECRGEILDILKMLVSELNASYTRCCYFETFEDFLSRYDLSEYQYQRILKLTA